MLSLSAPEVLLTPNGGCVGGGWGGVVGVGFCVITTHLILPFRNLLGPLSQSFPSLGPLRHVPPHTHVPSVLAAPGPRGAAKRREGSVALKGALGGGKRRFRGQVRVRFRGGGASRASWTVPPPRILKENPPNIYGISSSLQILDLEFCLPICNMSSPVFPFPPLVAVRRGSRRRSLPEASDSAQHLKGAPLLVFSPGGSLTFYRGCLTFFLFTP